MIVTVTMNPAIDISTSVAEVAPYRKLRCTPIRRDPGGGGIIRLEPTTRLLFANRNPLTDYQEFARRLVAATRPEVRDGLAITPKEVIESLGIHVQEVRHLHVWGRRLLLRWDLRPWAPNRYRVPADPEK